AAKNSPFAFERFLAETVAAVHKPDDLRLRTLVNLALPKLSGLLRELHEAASLDLEDYEQLHQIRIRCKRLRYAMEVFADCFAPAFRAELYPNVEAMQEILGNANDSYVACQRLDALSQRLQALAPAEWKRYRPGLEGLLQHHQSRLPQERQRFQEWGARFGGGGGGGGPVGGGGAFPGAAPKRGRPLGGRPPAAGCLAHPDQWCAGLGQCPSRIGGRISAGAGRMWTKVPVGRVEHTN